MKLNIHLIGLLLVVTFLLVGCGENTYEGDYSYEIQDFTATNQNGETVTLDDLKGEFWIADNIFTSCETACPVLTTNMVRLQQMINEEGLNVNLVSFSVDPTVDSPEKLAEFSAKYQADTSNWHFLTGYTENEIKTLMIKSFKALVDHPDNAEPIHMNSFWLVSPDGVMIKRYDGTKSANMNEIVEDLKGYLG